MSWPNAGGRILHGLASLIAVLTLFLGFFVDPLQAQSAMSEAARRAVADGAPGDSMDELVVRWQERGYPNPPGILVIRAITQAARGGLPAEPLAQKAIEGLAKGAAAEQIVRVVERRAETLRDAGNLLTAPLADLSGRPQSRTRAIEAVSDALFQGASSTDLARVIQQVGAANATVRAQWIEAAADVVAGLMSSGIDGENAAEITILGINKLRSPQELRGLSSQALALRGNGLGPSKIADQLRQSVESGRSLGPSTEPPSSGSTIPRGVAPSIPRPPVRPPGR